jgi:TatD DNase family protein
MMLQWIDSHCHLDAPEFVADREAVLQRAQKQGVNLCVMPAVQAKDFLALQNLAHQFDQPYALGIHPLFVPHAQESDLQILHECIEQALQNRPDGQGGDPRLVAVGEIGLDFFVPHLCQPEMREKQMYFYHAQLKLAQKFKLPVIMHVRKSADELLRGLRRFQVQGGIAHAFNGSFQQAHAFIELGFALGFGGALTFDRALQLRRLAKALPMTALVLETDAPDIPPHWLYRTKLQQHAIQQERPPKSEATDQQSQTQSRNEPCELPRIAACMAKLRGISLAELACSTVQNTQRVLPQIQHFKTA